jgi:hypothetical protein
LLYLRYISGGRRICGHLCCYPEGHTEAVLLQPLLPGKKEKFSALKVDNFEQILTRNISNISCTAAIDVLFSFNFAGVFDFISFRFRPSKANQ